MRTPFVLVLASGVLAMLTGAFFLWRGRLVRRADAAPTRPGRAEPVRYDPEDPTRVMLARGATRAGPLGWLFTALGIAGVLVGLVAVGFWTLLVFVLEVPA